MGTPSVGVSEINGSVGGKQEVLYITFWIGERFCRECTEGKWQQQNAK